MTSYPILYFDKTPGTLEQLVLATISQSLVNKDYVLSIIRDFTTGSINWDVTTDANNLDNPTANLNISVTFPTLPFDRQSLVDRATFDERIASLNSLSIDTLSLPQNPAYPLNSFPAQLPAYLNAIGEQNTLERRLLALILHIHNIQNWIERWNRCASHWILITYSSAANPFRTLTDVELERDDLLAELTNGFTYKALPADLFENGYPTTQQAVNPGNVRAEIEVLNGGGESDPATIQSSISESLLIELKQQLESNFANNNADITPPTFTSTEAPSLPDC